jgi:hypothetical protein
MSDGLTPAELIADIKNHGHEVSDWERNFCKDIAEKIQAGWTLTEKQIAKLKAIHEDRVG